LLALAKSEPVAEVRAQLASSVTRLAGKDALPITRELLLRSEDVTDKHVPLLLWWAIESKCATDRDAILRMLEDSTFWHAPIVQKFIIARLGQRFTAERTDANLETAAKLFALAPSPADADELIKGMEAGLQGDAVKSVPPALAKKVAELWASRAPTPTLISFAVRLGHAPAATAALARISDAKVPEADRRKTITLLAERRVDAAVPTFLKLLRFEKSDALRLDLVNALQRFASPDIARELLDLYPGFSGKLRDTAQAALASRPDWSRRLLAAVDEGQLKKEQISIANLLAITAFKDATSDALIKKHWGRLTKSSEEKEAQIAKVKKLLASGKGDAKAGHELFKIACAVCHTLNKEGGKIGPDLTGYERDNLDFILPAIVDPSLAIREEYIAFNIATTDAQTLTGLVTELSKTSVTLLDIGGNKTVLSRTNIKDMQASHTSLMPEGLLDAMTEQQVKDLFAYFMSSAPVTKK
jgi:putative heme-binding domain-containing protein